MTIDVLMPKLSDTMEEGKILKWFKQPGDAVKIGDVLAEVETDKANMELESYDEGVLTAVHTGEGDSAPVGAVIAVLGEPGEAAARSSEPAGRGAPAPDRATEPQASATTPPGPTAAALRPSQAAAAETGASSGAGDALEPPARSPEADARRAPAPARRDAPAASQPRPAAAGGDGDRAKASPLARRIATEEGVDLRGVTGTGPGGRIVERDVRAAAAESAQGRPIAPTRPEPARPAAPARAEERPAPRSSARPPAGRIELTKMRRTTARRMAEAKREVPHFYASADVAMDEAARLKADLAALGGDYDGVTYTHLVVKAVGLALRRVPEVNASYDGEGVVLHDTVNVGVATSVDDGLVVPVARDCDRQPLHALVGQVRGLVERARAGRFAGDDLSGATFTVSNLGMFPVSHFAAVVNPPQAAILAVGTVRETPVVRDGALAVGRVMTVTLSCDHRLVDGALAGRFLKELKGLLEHPIALVA